MVKLININKNMKYYSKFIFRILMAINIADGIIGLLNLIWSRGWAGSWYALLFNGEGLLFNISIYILPLLYFIFSTIIIFLQEKGHKRIGYFMIISSVLSIYYFIGLQMKWAFWSNIGFFLIDTPWYVFIFEFLLVLGSLVPFYVLGRLLKEDFLDKR